MSAPDLDNIDAADLRDNERLGALYLEAVHRKFWANTDQSVLDFWCLAEKALHDDRAGTPGRLFYALVKRKSAQMITERAEQAALARMPSARSPCADPTRGHPGEGTRTDR